MSDFGAVARPYAEAIFSLAKEKNDFEKWSDVLNFVSTLSQNDELNAVLHNPSVDKDSKYSLVASLVEKAHGGKADDQVLRLVQTLLDNNRLAAVTEISHRYEILRKDIDNQLDVTVETALDMDAAEKAKLTESLEKKFGKKISLEIVLKPELIGGMVIHAGDTVIDDSVSSKLKKLSSVLKK